METYGVRSKWRKAQTQGPFHSACKAREVYWDSRCKQQKFRHGSILEPNQDLRMKEALRSYIEHMIQIFHVFHMINTYSYITTYYHPPPSVGVLHQQRWSLKHHNQRHQSTPNLKFYLSHHLISFETTQIHQIMQNPSITLTTKVKIKWLIEGIKIPHVRALIPWPLSYIVVTMIKGTEKERITSEEDIFSDELLRWGRS